MSKFICGATADIGFEREKQEDYIHFKEFDENLLCIIADGTGSRENYVQPAVVATLHTVDMITKFYENNKELFMDNITYFMEMALISANSVLGGFKMGNEELYSGYAASMTCCFLTENRKLHTVHTGNTRLYVMRNGVLRQMTKDHTKGAELLNEGKIDLQTYHVHPDRLLVTGGVGMYTNPPIQKFSGSVKENDIILMTTDGIHYAIQPEHIANIILESEDCVMASKNLVEASKTVVRYPDNCSCIVIH